VIERHAKPDVGYATYLKLHDIKSLDKDSIESYSGAYYNFGMPILRTDAFEMFKISGLMRLMNDKELVISLCGAYQNLMGVSESWKTYFQEKTDELRKESPLLPESERREVKFAPMYNFYILGIPYILLNDSEITLSNLEEVVKRLEEQINGND
jgi:hypothetical protein